MYRKPTAPQVIGGVLDNAFALFKTSWTRVLGLALVAALGSATPTLFSNPFANFAALLDPANTDPPELSVLRDLPVMLASLLVSSYCYVAVMARMHGVANGRTSPLRDTLMLALRRYPALVGYALIVAGVFGVSALLAVMLAGGVVAGVGASVPALVFALLLGVVLFAPLLILFIYWYFAVFVIVTEGLGPVDALRRSFRLVRGFWGRTTVMVTVAYFVYLAIAALAGVIALAAGTVAGFSDLNVRLVTFVGEVATGAATTPFLLAVSLAIFYDLDLRRGGGDLAVRIDATLR